MNTETKSTLDMVKEFHLALPQPTNNFPFLHDEGINRLRVKLLREELDELEAALEARDAVEVLDALTDLQYVLDGAYLALGFHAVKQAAFEEVHRSNMSKMWSPEEVNEYWPNGHPDVDFEIADVSDDGMVVTKYIAYRKGDRKIIKPRSYSPANLQPMIEGFGSSGR